MAPQWLPVVKNIHGRRWNPDALAWEAPLTKITVRFVEKYLAGVAQWTFTPSPDLPERMELPAKPKYTPQYVPARYEAAVTALEQVLLLKRYSHNTVKTYIKAFRQFILFYNDRKPSSLTRADIDAFIVHQIKTKGISESHQNQILSAIKYRCTILSPKVWQQLQEYIAVYRPVEWVFEGQDGGAYSSRSVQKIFTRAKIHSGINPYATVELNRKR